MSIDTNMIEQMVKDHMETQPDKMVCADCGAAMDYDVDVDKWLDMTVTVTPCDCARSQNQEDVT